ncbi:type II secretion system protein M [Pseudomonas granadensis]|uniref:type II secretion system protein GspM n=1 Tax=Pseudomonas granadensis TaxID=1421430 RepID=UPI0019D078BC|nr:type II secretion system protein GspM [Pseudomonas granadensis]MBN6776632.1 type II secretion system protein M [Pseudomonas granadensis]MBN6807491.1 type II secretion system protein M [Pseudomonas granadensis]MBN6834353.1 type II secretion system protein M [Pseudomonas granadensis]MBN6841864.1 type II secretion system protein M [Pseudomonas granadensis]MBN6870819.1 type II secretion system protein M [Pseudomonas granadensis]
MSKLAPYRAKWQRFNAQLQARWQPLAPREKRMVGGMAVALIGLLLWVALIQPPLKKISYWQTETPKLRAQTEALEVLLRDVSVRPDGQSVAQALEQTLQASNLAGHYQLQLDAAGAWQLSFDGAPADAVLDWLLSTPAQLSLQVVEARLQRADNPSTEVTAGTLSGTVRMDQALGAKEAS